MTIEKTAIREMSLAMQAERDLEPRDHTMLHASAIGYCRRRQGFELMGTEGERTDSHFLSICDVGHGVHRQLQDRLVNVLKWATWENIELKVQDEEEGICGRLDALSEALEFKDGRLVPGPEGDKYIIDFKTITTRPHIKYNPDTGILHYVEPSSFGRLTEPKKEHLLQTNIYSWLLVRMGYLETYPKIMVVYVGKDIGREDYEGPEPLLDIPYKVFIRDTEESYIEAGLKRARHIWGRVRKGELPGKDHWHKPDAPAWQCEVCPYRKTCYAEEGYFFDEPQLISPSSLLALSSYTAG